ncbi:MAG: ParB/RepB/Spo0J family partition protein [bacterium]
MARKKILNSEGLDALRMILTRDSESSIVEVPIDDLVPNPNQPRKQFEGLAELGESIRSKGVVQPLIVRQAGLKYQIVAGERRWRAARQYTNLKTLPCIVKDLKDDEAMEISLIENLQREDLNPIDRTAGILSLLNLRMRGVEGFDRYENGALSVLNYMMHYDQGERAGNNVIPQLRNIVEDTFSSLSIRWQSFLKNYVPLLSLPEDLKTAMIEHPGDFKPAHAREVSKIEDVKLRNELTRAVIDRGLGLRELRQLVKEYRGKLSSNEEPQRPKQMYLTFDDLPGARIRMRNNRFSLSLDLKRGDLVRTLTLLLKKVKSGEVQS